MAPDHPSLLLTVILLLNVSLVSAYNVVSTDRRSLLRDFLWKGAAMGGAVCRSTEAQAEPMPLELESLYFGCGCFWHLQHSVAVFERDMLGRGGSQLKCKAGYAGGKKGADKEGRVCYHNLNNIADYGKLGHGEVVGLELPPDRIVDVAKLYFSQFDPKTKGETTIPLGQFY